MSRPHPTRASASSRDRDSELVQEAVQRAKRGDAEGMHFLYVRHVGEMRRYVASIVHDQHEAEDITQEVFAKLMTRLDRYQPREVPFGAWIMRVARNAALDYMRARRVLPSEEVRIADPGRTEVDASRASELRRAFEELPDDQREVLVLRHVVGLSPGEIASALERSESSVHGLHHRGRRSLRAKLVELGAAPTVARRTS